MKKVLVLIVLLCVAGSASASIDWLTNAASSDWFTAANWSGGVVPSSTNATNVRTFQTHYNANFNPTIADGDATAYQVEVGGDNDAVSANKNVGKLYINSGTLTVTDYFRCGASSTSNRWGAIYMNGGTVNVGGQFTVGLGSTTLDVRGYLYMNGGTINVTGSQGFVIASASGATGTAQLYGGTINTTAFSKGSGTASLDIKGTGLLSINGNVVSAINSDINAGWLKTTEAGKTIQVIYDDLANKTLVSAVPEPATMCLLGLGAMSLLRRKK